MGDCKPLRLGSTHSYYGAATLLLGLYQPLNAFLRPPGRAAGAGPGSGPGPGAGGGGGEKSTARGRWEWVHRGAGVAALLMSVVAVTSGTGKAADFGAEKGGPAAYRAYVAGAYTGPLLSTS